MSDVEILYTQLIAYAGDARSSYIEAIHLAKKGSFDEAYAKIEEGKDGELPSTFVEGHKIHFELMSNPQDEFDYTSNLLLIHAEDQLASAESFGIMAAELIDIIKEK